MIGKSDMSLYGWKQLIEWSLEHACLSSEQYASIHAAWEKKWDIFLDEVIVEFGEPSVSSAAAAGGAAATSPDVKS